ncbi:hypothetical protein CFC21_027066 [Triticum aestivum]|uniref:Uncharacterized protein n=2 Tax=Triticum aestivum TaxID=4565 RepID=A0A9R1EMH1_WHEAT|nr:hypothetical protein CFC21_027066 [Triticum aestivum]
MGSTEAILSAQIASQFFSTNKFMESPVPQIQKQSDGGRRQTTEKKELNNDSAVKQRQQQQLKPRFALELDGLNCFETLVPL